jgi:Transcriptional regulators
MDHSVVAGMLHGLRMLGKRVPDDISIISCDDYPETPFLNPPLTVVDIPNRELGYLAAQQIYRMIRGLAPLPSSERVKALRR